MTDSPIPASPAYVNCPECANFVVGEPQHRRLREECPLCRTPLLINDRYTIARKLSGNFHTDADVFVVFDNQEDGVQKIL